MKKALGTILTLAIAAAAGLAVGLFQAKSCGGPDPKYWMKVSTHEEAVRIFKADHEISLGEIERWKADSAAKQKTIDADVVELQALGQKSTRLETANAGLKVEAAKLKEDVAAVLEANPGVQRLVVNLEFQIKNLEEDVFVLKDKLTLVGDPKLEGVDAAGQKIYTFPEKSIAWALQGQVRNERERGDRWERDYGVLQHLFDDEHGLRLTAEKGWRLSGTVAKVIAVGAGGFAGYQGIKGLGHLIKLW